MQFAYAKDAALNHILYIRGTLLTPYDQNRDFHGIRLNSFILYFKNVQSQHMY